MDQKRPVSNPIKNILSIEEFKLAPEDIKELYARAYALPEFFLTNLISRQRVVKSFTGKMALIQAFYFQLMKLTLEVDIEDRNFRDELMDRFIKYKQFGQGDLEDQLFSDFQYRKFFKDFIQIVERESIPKFEAKADQYPIIDQILKKYFKLIVPIPMLMKIQDKGRQPIQAAEEMLKFLCQYFQISFSKVGPCFKFEQADIFLYLQNIDEIYMAFDDESIHLQQDGQSQLASTFKCGEGNSFVTKYHSQSGQKSSDSDQTKKRFIKSKYWNNRTDMEPVIVEEKEELQTPLLRLNHISCSSDDSNQFQRIAKRKQDPSPLQTSKFNEQFKSSFSGKLTLQKQNTKQCYDDFTSSFIVSQLSPRNRENVNNIKQKYKPRQSIRPLF